MTTKKFHISDVLSITTGALVSERHMDGIYDIMGHIVGDNGISTIGLAANAQKAEDFLKETLPWTKDVSFPKIPANLDNEGRVEFCHKWVGEMAAKYGEYQDVGQLSAKPDVSLGADIAFVAKVKSKPNPAA